jgi:dienelactone hydrolase
MQHEIVTYSADGATMRSQFFVAAGGGRKPTVLVFPEAFGLGEHALTKAERLAGMGYAVLAADYYGDGKTAGSLDEAIGMMGPVAATADITRARGMAALRALAARPEADAARMAAIGFCFGGTMALELARAGAPLRAVAGFHSGLGTKGPAVAPGSIQPRILACIGADDPMIPPEQRAAFEAEMRDAGADWQLHIYGGTVHSFTNPAATDPAMAHAVRYNPVADARSWAAMETLFAETMG